MAERLLKYYKYITEQKGIMGKIELAKETTLPSVLAASEPDSVEKGGKKEPSLVQLTRF